MLQEAGATIAAVGSGVNLIQDIFGSDEPSDWHKEQYFEQRDYARAMAERNIALQKEFAQHGVRWKLEDAKAAGIHPVAALGGGGASFAPITVGEVSAPPERRPSQIGNAMMDMGQNISRAVKASSDIMTRQQLEANELDLEAKRLEIQILGQRLTGLQRSQVGPAQPSLSAVSPEEKVMQPDITYTKTKTGGVAPVPSEAFADRAEDQFLPQLAWAARNLLLPMDPDRPPPKGTVWSWNPGRFEFDAVKPPARWWITPRDAWDTARRWINEKTR